MKLRRCIVCDQPIEHKPAHCTTCGHPRCMRTARGNGKRVRERRTGGELPVWKAPDIYASDEKTRRTIVREWARFGDYSVTERLVSTAKAAGVSVAVVMGVMRSVR